MRSASHNTYPIKIKYIQRQNLWIRFVLYFGKISTGASDDLNKAYQIAKTIITQYGFGDKIGWVQYDETEYAKEYSKDT